VRRKLVSTAEAAAELGVSVRTLQQWRQDGTVLPDVVTPGGHARWDVERLRRELRDQRQRDE
jgi:DNA-binding transcriptional MerR regulator